MAGDAVEIVSSIKRSLRLLVVATIVLYVGLVGVTVKAGIDAARNKSALCELRADLERRVASSQQFLRDNPKGVPGISVKTINTGIQNQKLTIQALSGLSC